MQAVKFTKQVFQAFGKDKIGQQSAAFAYIAIFSFGPMLLVLISVISFIYGQQAAQGALFNHLTSVVGTSTAKTLQTLVANTHKSGHNILALIVGAVGVLLGAGGITSQLQNSFNSIFNVVPDPQKGIKSTIYTKLKNIVLVLLGAVVILASLIVSTLTSQAAKFAANTTHTPPVITELINSLVSLIIFIGILYFIYKVLSDIKLPPKVTLMASAVVSLLFLIGKLVLGIIIGNNATASAYGAAASLVTLLLWVYYSGQILFIGAEGIKVHCDNVGINLAAKKQSLKRQTVVYDSNDLKGLAMEAFLRGFRSDKSKKK